jgi:hypothetical protein
MSEEKKLAESKGARFTSHELAHALLRVPDAELVTPDSYGEPDGFRELWQNEDGSL